MAPKALRTPDDRFAGLPGFAFAPHYRDDLPGYEGLRLHYLDEGPAQAARTFLCLHGQPTWGYLYRKMIPVFVAAGHRVVVPDLFGFGRSDKPQVEESYTFDFHRETLLAFIEALDLHKITLVIQDWGGILGLTLPMAIPERIADLVIMNTALATGTLPLPDSFFQWRDWCRKNPDIPVGKVMRKAYPALTEEEVAAYEAPYPDSRFKAGVRRFPELVPDGPDKPGAPVSRQALRWLKTQWSGRAFLAVGATDPMLGPPVMGALSRGIRGCPPPHILEGVGHFVQEERGAEVARLALAALA
jgi:pimeloyl-ACP methyl ester carboxylesterase